MHSERELDLLRLEPAARAARLQVLEIDDQVSTRLRELSVVLEPHVEELIDLWHEFLRERPETRRLLPAGAQHLRAVQASYFRSLLAGNYDAEYFEERLRIGFVHERVGLEPVWYTSSYRKLQDLVREYLIQHAPPEAPLAEWLRALEKVVYLDMQLALDAYFYTRSQQLRTANQELLELSQQLRERGAHLARQFEHAQEAARIKEEFLAKVSHELHTPLNAIIGFADLLADGIEGPVTDEQGRSLEKIHHHGHHLLRMIEQMIDAAKMAAAGIQGPRRFDPGPALERLGVRCQQMAEQKGLRCVTRIEEDLPPVLGDPEGFTLALAHLLENAVKFTTTGEVGLDATTTEDRLRCLVRDTGSGIPQGHRERIFEPFHQVDSGDTRAASGLGMGLTLARQGLQRMGGSLHLEDSEPLGSTFSVELPLWRPDDSDEETPPR